MSSGGSWQVQNKVRPGFYINFVSVPRPIGSLGTRGTVAIGMPMSWGPEGELITLTGDMLVNGKSLPVVGCDAFDTEASLKYRVACAGCYTALLYRTDRGGVKASAVQGTAKFEALYPGLMGNRLIVEISREPESGAGPYKYTVVVLVNDIERESFVVTTLEEFYAIESQYVKFSKGIPEVTVLSRHKLADDLADTYGLAYHDGGFYKSADDTFITEWGKWDEVSAALTAAVSHGLDEVLVDDVAGDIYSYTEGTDETVLVKEGDPVVAEEIPLTAGTPLLGGADGEVSQDTYSSFMEALDYKDFQCMTIVDGEFDSALASVIKSKIEIWRERRGKKVQAVVYNAPNLDYEGIISVNQGFKTPNETVGTDLFCAYVASLTAGAEINESLTCKVVENAVEIINPIQEDDIEDALLAGRFVITYREDGAVIVEKDINTLHTFTTDKNYEFSKNRVMRVLDQLARDGKLIFNKNYCGKESNTQKGRNNFKVEMIHLIDQMMDISAVKNFEAATDIEVLPGEAVDSVVMNVYLQPVDSMEKIYATVYVRG